MLPSNVEKYTQSKDLTNTINRFLIVSYCAHPNINDEHCISVALRVMPKEPSQNTCTWFLRNQPETLV